MANSTLLQKENPAICRRLENHFNFIQKLLMNIFDSIEWIEVDFEDIHSLQKCFKWVEVYHCAAKVSFHPKDEKNVSNEY